ncbi:MAG: hypothetical protein JWQ71_1932 [Pedosphaera sp.]|nr:hypothetical protein [Pedosphaera sp.]
MECKITSTKSVTRRGRAAFTLMEMVVTGSIGLLILLSLGAVQMYSSRSFAAQYNYVDLNNQSHHALDKISQMIRPTARMTAFATNDITFTYINGNTIRYTYSPTARTLTQIASGTNAASTTNTILLRGCDWLKFSMYQRNPINGSFNQVVATNVASCKLLQVQWSCSRSLFAKQTNETEVMESAKIVIRNNP